MRLRLLLLPVLVGLAPFPAQADGRGGRLRPPDYITCDRNELTSFSGEVTALKRAENETLLRMSTDEATEEEFVWARGVAAVAEVFRLRGAAFGEADWKVILEGDTVRTGMRANVWVCLKQEPIVDWQPPRAED